MTDHNEEGHQHTLSCLALDRIAESLAGLIEEGLGRPIGYVFHFLDPETGDTQCATNLPQPIFADFMTAASEAVATGGITEMPLSGDTMQ